MTGGWVPIPPRVACRRSPARRHRQGHPRPATVTAFLPLVDPMVLPLAFWLPSPGEPTTAALSRLFRIAFVRTATILADIRRSGLAAACFLNVVHDPTTGLEQWPQSPSPIPGRR